MKKNLLKTLFVAIGILCTNTANALIEEYDFETWGKNGYSLVREGSYSALTAATYWTAVVKTEESVEVDRISLNGRFAGRIDGNALLFRGDRYQGIYGSRGAGLAILNLKAGNKVTFFLGNSPFGLRQWGETKAFDEDLSTEGAEGATVDPHYVSGQEYTVSNDGDVIVQVNQYTQITKIVIEADETATMPSISVAANGIARTITIEPGLSSAGNGQTAYYTTDGSDPDLGSTAYSGPFDITENCTLKVIGAIGTSTSAVIEMAITAGTEIKLNAPVFTVTDLLTSPTFNLSIDNSNLLGKPEAEVSITFEGSPVSMPFTPSKPGYLSVTTSAPGYGGTADSYLISNKYEQKFASADFSSITESDVTTVLGENWKFKDNNRWANWNKDNSYTSYGYQFEEETPGSSPNNITVQDNLRMRAVVNLFIGYGLGRNTTGSETVSVVGCKEGDLAIFTIYNGFGNKSIAEGSYEKTLVSNGTYMGTSLPGGNNLVKAVIYKAAGELPTAIQGVKNVEVANEAIYNLAGQEVKNAKKGIFIQNGKKVVR